MLRHNTESFAPEFAKVLSALGVKNVDENAGFQLLKFERVEPDSFVWLLQDNKATYVATLQDGGSDVPSTAWLARWTRGLTADQFKRILPRDVDPITYRGLEDDYDYVQVYQLPDDYDHDNDQSVLL